MTREEAKYILRNTAFLAPSLVPVDEAVDMACDALDKVTYINSQLDKADRKTEPTISKMEQVERDCTGCKFIGTYDTEFPCANCSRKTKDYYAKDEPQTESAWR